MDSQGQDHLPSAGAGLSPPWGIPPGEWVPCATHSRSSLGRRRVPGPLRVSTAPGDGRAVLPGARGRRGDPRGTQTRPQESQRPFLKVGGAGMAGNGEEAGRDGGSGGRRLPQTLPPHRELHPPVSTSPGPACPTPTASPDVLRGVPPLRGQLPALGVIDGGVEDGDAHVPSLCSTGGSAPVRLPSTRSPAPPAPGGAGSPRRCWGATSWSGSERPAESRGSQWGT